jgi:hypothetical protein
MAMTMNGIEMNAESVMGLFAFMDPTRNKRRIFTSEDLVKESEKLRTEARVQFHQTRATDQIDTERTSGDADKRLGRTPASSAVSNTSGNEFRAHHFAAVALR